MKTILVIDSESESLVSLSQTLTTSGYAVIAIRDGASALAIIGDGMPIDLIITACRIEGMDGLEMITSIKTIAPSIPTIMLSAYGTIETYLKAISLGVFEFLNKPVKPTDIGRIVKAALEKSHVLDHSQGRIV